MALTGVIVAQLGGPETLDDVEPFIRSIFSDPRLVPLPGGSRTRSIVSKLVSRLRGAKVRSHYAAIGGGSPILETTQKQAEALESELIRRGHDVVVAVAHRHSQPDTSVAVSVLKAAGVDRVILFPLFPHYSGATTGSSEDELRRVMSEWEGAPPLTVIRSWCEHPSYLESQVELIEDVLGLAPEDDPQSVLVVFSAHGLPQSMIDRGDLYVEEIEANVVEVVSRLKVPFDHVIAYQSRASPVKWVGPNVKAVIVEAPANGYKWLCLVPISFVSEHVETSYELDIELKAIAAKAGINEFHRVKCLDTGANVGPMLADIVEEYL